jgi:predicted flap endonuclease-1-like 5' DNA nuclease
VPARERLSPIEQILAYFMGLGLAVIILAFWLGTLENVDRDGAESVLIVGVAVLILGTIAWLYLSRPWKSFGNFDPMPDEHGAHEPHAIVASEPHLPAVVEPAGLPAVIEAQAPAPAEPVAEAEAEAPEREAEPKPELVTEEPLPLAPDDLTQISGIGARAAKALNDAGITTLAQIAAMTPDALSQVVRDQGVRLVGSTETWPAQAQALLAARG